MGERDCKRCGHDVDDHAQVAPTVYVCPTAQFESSDDDDDFSPREAQLTARIAELEARERTLIDVAHLADAQLRDARIGETFVDVNQRVMRAIRALEPVRMWSYRVDPAPEPAPPAAQDESEPPGASREASK